MVTEEDAICNSTPRDPRGLFFMHWGINFVVTLEDGIGLAHNYTRILQYLMTTLPPRA